MTAGDLGRLLRDSVPELDHPSDRIESVRRRAGRARQRRAAAAAGVVVVTIAVGSAVLFSPSSSTPVAAPPISSSRPDRPAPNTPIDAANRLIAFAWNPTREHFDQIPFAGDTVQLALGTEVVKTVPIDELAKPANWWLDVEYFEAFVGPFSALDVLSWQTLTPTVGEHKKCVSPPTPAPAGLAHRTQVAIQPDGIDTCIRWFAVDLYLDDRNQILAVRLDRFQP